MIFVFVFVSAILVGGSSLDIKINRAEHLDSEREPILEIYTYVNETDDVTYVIPEGEYVRAYFERNLTDGTSIVRSVPSYEELRESHSTPRGYWRS